ncbi:MAG TPA: hypothetical protein VGU24_20745 [Microvirga sp.]|jgi:propanediol dehydratase small subunit|nr:hypothetical protein [Microvirga sp.]
MLQKSNEITWQEIVEVYRSLPDDHRTGLHTAHKINENQRRAPGDWVSDVLKATVLGERITAEDLKVTAKVARALVDLSRTSQHDDTFTKNVTLHAQSLTRGLDRIDMDASREIYVCIAHMLSIAEEHLNEPQNRYAYRHYRPAQPRYVLPEEDIPF